MYRSTSLEKHANNSLEKALLKIVDITLNLQRFILENRGSFSPCICSTPASQKVLVALSKNSINHASLQSGSIQAVGGCNGLIDGVSGLLRWFFPEYSAPRVSACCLETLNTLCFKDATKMETIPWQRVYNRVLHQTLSSFIVHFDQRTTHYGIPGLLSGAYTCATHDTAAQINTINTKFALSNGYKIEAFDESQMIETFNKRRVKSDGILKLRWAYQDSQDTEVDIVLHAVPDSPHDVIFGFPFLKANGLLEDNKGRILSLQVCGHQYQTRKVCFQKSSGSTLPMARGKLDNRDVEALADTGCDVNIMSRSYAEANGHHIDNRHQETLTFSDGSTDTTIGRVVSPWVFGNSGIKHTLPFEVLEDCQFDVVLGKHILFGTKAFKTYRESFDFGEEDAVGSLEEISAEPARNPVKDGIEHSHTISYLVNSVRKSKYRHRIIEVLEHGLGPIPKGKPPSQQGGRKLTPDERSAEIERRAKAESIIDAMPLGQKRQEAYDAEERRRQGWFKQYKHPIAPSQ